MSRGLLSDEELRQIEQQLPDTTQVATLVHEHDPDSVAMQVGSMNRLPNAAVCLHDVLPMAQEAPHALHGCDSAQAYGTRSACSWNSRALPRSSENMHPDERSLPEGTSRLADVEAGQLLSLEPSPTEGQSGPVVAVRHPVGCGQPQDGVATKALSTGDVALKIAPFFYLWCPAVYHAGCIVVDIRKRSKVNLTLVEGLAQEPRPPSGKAMPLFARSSVIAS